MSDARDKISKLLNMTVANGCSEDEQETALRMAAGLAAKHGIELDSVQAKTAGAPKRKAISKTIHQDWKIHQVLAARAAAVLYGVEAAEGRSYLFFVGREENIELTEQTMFWLMRQVELLYKEHLPRGLSQRDRAEYRKTFKAACAHRVYQRSVELMRQMKNNDQAAHQATGQNALVVQGYFKTLADENYEFWSGGVSREEAQEAARKREAAEQDRRNALTPIEREKEDKALEQLLKKAAKRKGPRPRYLPTGTALVRVLPPVTEYSFGRKWNDYSTGA